MTRRKTPDLYDRDFHAWALNAAQRVREGRLSKTDLAHVAEEIASLAAQDRRELRRRLATIMEHLLNLRSARGSVLDQIVADGRRV